ncbi:MAG: hypothetical protein HAW61_02295, partial [Candidatus Portiera sp.]|nr:hypothetical protein [Portiera sp.]
MIKELHNNVRLLKQLLPYINRYRRAKFLFVIPSYFFTNPNQEQCIWEDIATCRSLGIGCLVFIDYDWQLDSKSGISNEKLLSNSPLVAGMESQARYELFKELSGYNEKVNVVSGIWLLAQPKGVLKGKDMQNYGTLRSVDIPNLLSELLSRNLIVMSNIAPDKHGNIYALDTTETAATVAQSLAIDKVILYVDDLAEEYRQVAVELAEAKKMSAS